jgi:hypothetical protein
MTQPDGADYEAATGHEITCTAGFNDICTCTSTLAQLRERIADAIQQAAHDCDSDTGPDAGACRAQHPIQIGAWHHGVVSDVYGPVDAITAAVLAVVQPEMDAHEQLHHQLADSLGRPISTPWGYLITAAFRAYRAADLLSGAERERQEAEAALAEARATNERLNYRAQTAESRLNAATVAVANWQVGENGTYVPLHTLAAITKAVGIHHDTSRWEMHHERVAELEAALAETRGLLADLTDPDPCWFDHHGYCQAHGWMATEPACPHARAKALTAPSPPAP